MDTAPTPSAPEPPARTLLRDLRVTGTALEQSLQRAVDAPAAGRPDVAAFSSSI